MRKNIKNKGLSKSVFKRCTTALLAFAIIMQTMLFGVGATVDEISNFYDSSSVTPNSSLNGEIANFDSEALKEALQSDVIKYMKKDLLQRIEDNSLTGSAEVILLFSDKSLIDEYTEKKQ